MGRDFANRYLILMMHLISSFAPKCAAFQARSTAMCHISSSLGILSHLSTQEARDTTRGQSTFHNVIIRQSKQSKAFRNGSQLVFSKAVEAIKPDNVAPASIVKVSVRMKESDSNMDIGWGVYNPFSLYTVRILCHKYLQPSLFTNVERLIAEDMQSEAVYAMVYHHVKDALLARRILIDSTKEDTDTFRLINGEGDGLSGLSIDVVGGSVAVVMSTSIWCQIHQEAIIKALKAVLPEHDVVWRVAKARLEQDGCSKLTRSLDMSDRVLSNSRREDDRVVYRENGVLFATYPFSSTLTQKTGVYCDQRENRLNLATLCTNKRVLDLCCYHGGFAITSIVRGGAAMATAVDSSQAAIEAAEVNAELNGIPDSRLKLVQADIAPYLQEQFSIGNDYDVVVLDPPKLAPTTKALDKARRKYHALNRDAIKVVSSERGGLLLTCTCSAAMTQRQDYFLNMVQGAALAAGRRVTLMRTSGAAACHTQSPIAWPSGAYLTACLFYVHPK